MHKELLDEFLKTGVVCLFMAWALELTSDGLLPTSDGLQPTIVNASY